MNLLGKVVLVTGGRRLGSHLARRLASRGAHIAFSSFSDVAKMEQEAVECAKADASGQVQTAVFQADLTQPEDAERVVRQTVERFGRLDILVNLTSTYRRTPLDELTVDDYRQEMATNIDAPYFTAVAAARQMRRQAADPASGLNGKILHYTDWAVERPYRDFLPYLIGKGAVVTLTKALAAELAPCITVNAIALGTMLPPPNVSPERIQQITDASALNRIGSPDDVTAAALYLLEGTDFVTGEIYRVDGGRFLGSAAGNPCDGE